MAEIKTHNETENLGKKESQAPRKQETSSEVKNARSSELKSPSESKSSDSGKDTSKGSETEQKKPAEKTEQKPQAAEQKSEQKPEAKQETKPDSAEAAKSEKLDNTRNQPLGGTERKSEQKPEQLDPHRKLSPEEQNAVKERIVKDRENRAEHPSGYKDFSEGKTNILTNEPAKLSSKNFDRLAQERGWTPQQAEDKKYSMNEYQRPDPSLRGAEHHPDKEPGSHATVRRILHDESAYNYNNGKIGEGYEHPASGEFIAPEKASKDGRTESEAAVETLALPRTNDANTRSDATLHPTLNDGKQHNVIEGTAAPQNREDSAEIFKAGDGLDRHGGGRQIITDGGYAKGGVSEGERHPIKTTPEGQRESTSQRSEIGQAPISEAKQESKPETKQESKSEGNETKNGERGNDAKKSLSEMKSEPLSPKRPEAARENPANPNPKDLRYGNTPLPESSAKRTPLQSARDDLKYAKAERDAYRKGIKSGEYPENKEISKQLDDAVDYMQSRYDAVKDKKDPDQSFADWARTDKGQKTIGTLSGLAYSGLEKLAGVSDPTGSAKDAFRETMKTAVPYAIEKGPELGRAMHDAYDTPAQKEAQAYYGTHFLRDENGNPITAEEGRALNFPDEESNT